MIECRSFAVPYCLALVEDASTSRDVRPIVTDRLPLAVSSGSSIAVGCQCDVEGETEFRLGDRVEVDPGTPAASLVVCEYAMTAAAIKEPLASDALLRLSAGEAP